MGISTSILLFAIGAILRFAVDVTTEGFDIQMVGVILMMVGAVGALISLAFWSSWGGFGGRYDNRGGDVVVDDQRPRRTVVVEKHS